MTIVLTQKLGKLALITWLKVGDKSPTRPLTIAAVLLNGIPLQQVHAQANNSSKCQKLPLSLGCQEYTFLLQAKQEAKDVSNNNKTIKIRLKTPGSNQEWLRIEINGNTVKPIHTIRTNRSFSQVVNSALGVVSPVPLPNVRFDKWLDAPTTRVIFEPESCSSQQPQPPDNSIQSSQPHCLQSCAIVGTDSVLLPEGTDIHQGRFTIEYTEGELIRTITFKIPNQD